MRATRHGAARIARAAQLLVAWLLAAQIVACGRGAPPILGCEPAHDIVPDCRFQNPEDLAPSPSGRFLLVSQLGSMDGRRAGSLAAYDPAAGTIEILFPGDAAPAGPAETPWGDPACPPPPVDLFSPHGIHARQLADGRHALYAVNHGGRESVEMFQVEDDGQRVALAWRGCVEAPEHGYFNDLVVLRNGDFWVSQMFPRDWNPAWFMLRAWLMGHATGHAYHWSPEAGFRRIPGSDARFANGIEKSADERYLFLAAYFGDEVLKVDTRSGTVVARAQVPRPDNLTWTPDGLLLAAGHRGSLSDMMACQDVPEGTCGFGFVVVAIDPETMATRLLLDHEGPPMGAATVALAFGDAVYLGTFAGDRIAKVSAEILE